MNSAQRFFKRKREELGVKLNEIQQQAVAHAGGPLLLLATPGSGKTTTLLMRIGYLIEEKGVHPSRIKAITFSRASAADMKERYQQFFPGQVGVDFSTIHSLAFEIVRVYFQMNRRSFRLIEGQDKDMEQETVNLGEMLHKKMILRDIYRAETGTNMTDDQLDEMMTYISYIKNKMIAEELWSSVPCSVKCAEQILREYERFKKSFPDQLLIDFDDMLTMANDILNQEPVLLRKYQQRYDYVLTDESQDTSMVQHAIIEKLVASHRNLYVVADDDQSIYSWRGAEPSYLLNFKSGYPEATILFMEQNFRSTKSIVETANSFIQRNQNRYKKSMYTAKDAGEPVLIRCLDDSKHQTKYLIEEIRKAPDLGEVAILYRNNASSVALVNAFDLAGIPFYIRDYDNRFFSHWVVQDVLNFMRMSYTDRRPDLLEAIHTKFNGYITKQQMAALKQINNQESVFDNLLKYVPLQDYQHRQLPECQRLFREMRGMTPLAAIAVIRKQLGYEKALEKMCERLGFRKDYLWSILSSLEEIAEPLSTMEEFAARLKHLETLLRTSKGRRGKHAVTFSTFHSAKGLEFKEVYMIDLVSGIIPSTEDLKTADRNSPLMEEAARLFYVGMTRAKSRLELLYYREREGSKIAESCFVSEVRRILRDRAAESQQGANQMAGQFSWDFREARVTTQHGHRAAKIRPNAIRFKEDLQQGMQVHHEVFGEGTIISAVGETVEIRFRSFTKKLSTEVCVQMGLLVACG